MNDGIKATTDKRIKELFPSEIISKSKIYNLVNAMQYKELFGVDLIRDFKASFLEIKTAQNFYDEFLQYKNDRKPAEEYEMVLHWAEDLKLNNFFELIDENRYRNELTNPGKLIESLEKDPLGLDSNLTFKERETEKFKESQKKIGLNMAVVMFMVEALQFFENKSKEEIKKIAVEITLQGTQGYDPSQTNYSVPSIPGKVFSGYHILAYYFVSWALTAPEMVSQLELPYDEEYKTALTLYKKE